MALMERVATLLRANLNDLIDRAQDPETLLRQFVLDLENQLIQVKTQVAMALADQHLVARKRDELHAVAADWHHKAELAVREKNDTIARAALVRALAAEETMQAVERQVQEQASAAEALHATYRQLERKLADTQARCEFLLAQHRRARLSSRAQDGPFENGQPQASPKTRAARRIQNRIIDAEVSEQATRSVLAQSSAEERLANLERNDRVEQLLADLKSKKQLLPTA